MPLNPFPGTLSTQAEFGESSPRSPDFAVRSFGGPTRINFDWEALLQASSHVQSAAGIFDEMRTELTALYSEFGGSGLAHLSWRTPGFHARLGALTAGLAGAEQGLSQAVTAVDQAHDSYRSMESTVQRWFQLSMRLEEADMVVEHLLSPEGDKSYVYDWLVTTGVIAGAETIDVLLARFPQVGLILGAVVAMGQHAGMTPALMGRNEQTMAPEPTQRFSHQADRSYGEYLQQMSEVTDHGDIAVSRIENPHTGPVYAVHLPGIDIDGVNLDQGRGPMSLLDGLGNDSAHMLDAVENALDAAEVPEGSIVHMSGFSLGGLHAANIAADQRFRQKYNLRSVTTIGSPLRNTRIEPGVKVTHFEDSRDPIPHLTGERPQQSPDRMLLELNVQNPHSSVESIAGSAHTWQHNVDAIRELEQRESDWLSFPETSHLDEFRAGYHGEVETLVFETTWTPQEDPQHLYPWEAESIDDLEYLDRALREGIEELRTMPGRDTATVPNPPENSPGGRDGGAARR